jgi:hypothetical protein
LADDPEHAAVIKELSQHLPTVNAKTAPGSSGLGSRAEDRHLFGNVK